MKILPLPLRLVVTIAFITFFSLAEAQTKAVAIVGGTLIDGSGRAPLEDAAVVLLNGRIQAVGKRSSWRFRKMLKLSTPKA